MSLKLKIAKLLYGIDPNKGEPIGEPQVKKQQQPQLAHVSKDLKKRFLRYKVNKFNQTFQDIRSQL